MNSTNCIVVIHNEGKNFYYHTTKLLRKYIDVKEHTCFGLSHLQCKNINKVEIEI